ncbi:MAG: ATP-binding protein [Aquificae bacterium]|nr:ATP-binding protein [Aquificota bacterium]
MEFINRTEELQRLREGLSLGESFVIVAPRRYGKTTLIRKVLEELEKDNVLTLYIDLMPYADSVPALSRHIVDTALDLLGIEGKIRKLPHLLQIKGKAVLKEEGIELDLEVFKSTDERKMLREALELPERIAKRKKKRMVVAFDEFGELYKTNISAVKLFRSVVQHHQRTSYIFAGSQETIMKKVFMDKDGVFFRFGTIMELGGLELEDTLEYALKNLPVEAGEFVELFKLLKGHPYYLVRVMGKVKSGKNIVDALEELIEEERAYVELLIERIIVVKHALEVLRAIANGQNPYDALQVKEQVVNRVLNKLVSYGYLRRVSRGVYEFTDPLLELYLKR